MPHHLRRRVMFALAAFATAPLLAIGQQTQPSQERVPVSRHWGNRFVFYSESGPPEQMKEVVQQTGFWEQWVRRHGRQSIPPTRVPLLPHFPLLPRPILPKIKKQARDWSESMGTSSYTQTQPAYPAKYYFNSNNPTPDCNNDYVVYTLAESNPGHDFNVIGFNNLYVNSAGTGFCAGTTPTAIFAYDASQNNGTLSTSPITSLDGTQVAFIEDASSSQFHVLKWKKGNVSTSTFPLPYNTSVLPNCNTMGVTAPCEFSVVYSSSKASFSAPYVDWSSDTAYVTDDHGLIAAISPVFTASQGNPPKVLWSLTTPAATNMTPAIFDDVSHNVFVADHSGLMYYVRVNSSSSGSCATGIANNGTPPCFGQTMSGYSLDVANTKEVWEPPMIDSTSQTIFLFSNNPPHSSGLSGSVIVQTTTTLSTEVVASIGTGGGENIFSGTPDNNYFNSPSTGRIYACGQANGGQAELYAFGFTGTTMNTTPVATSPLKLSSTATNCSPLTEDFNISDNKDYLYAGVATSCDQLGGVMGQGCIASFTIATGTTEQFPTATNATPVTESEGTTGIVVDNVQNASSGGNSSTNLYFTTQGTQTCTDYHGGSQSNGNCAVKLTQNGLQ